MVMPDDAVHLAMEGFRVFPLAVRSKVPVLKEWQVRATNDVRQVAVWTLDYPGCNWGLATGRGSGVFVLDIDGSEGETTFEGLLATRGNEWIQTRRSKTKNGWHLYFRYPDGPEIPNSVKKIAPGLDVRGEGGYVVAPPSEHPDGGHYQWLADGPNAPILDAPSWLLEMIANASAAVSPASQTNGGDKIGKGERNATLTSLGGTMRKRGMTPAAIEAALLAENVTHLEPPLSEVEVKKIAHSVCRYSPTEQKTWSPEVVTISNVEARAIDWLWRPYIPFGMLCMLSGDPGAGKTFLLLAIAAALTRGRSAGRSCEPAAAPMHILYMSVENSPEYVVRPRFDSLGGDPTRFHILKGAISGEEHMGVTLSDVRLLGAAIKQTEAKMVIVDPIQSYLGAQVDAHRSNETRPVMDGLVRLVEEFNVGAVLARHLAKAAGGKAIYRGLGSIDLTGAVRTELLAGVSPDDANQSALVHIKSNIGPYGPSQGYTIKAEAPGSDCCTFSWTGEVSIGAGDLLAPEPSRQEKEERSTLDEAKRYLMDALSGGPRKMTDLEAEGVFSKRTLQRASEKLHVRRSKERERGPVRWHLPS